MSRYKELKQQIAALEKQALEVKRNEQKEVLAQIRNLMTEFDIAVPDLVSFLKSAKDSAPPKYRHRETLATWSGHGRAPKWAAEAKANGTLEQLLIAPVEPAINPPPKEPAKANEKAAAPGATKNPTTAKAKPKASTGAKTKAKTPAARNKGANAQTGKKAGSATPAVSAESKSSAAGEPSTPA